MKRKEHILGILTALMFFSASNAAVSEQSARLETLRKTVETNKGPAAEKEYLNAFPKTFENFKQIFYGNNLDELYDTHSDHLSLLQRLSAKYPAEVLSIWMGVATNGHWNADAIGMLQHQLAEYGARHTKELATALLSKPKDKRLSIIRFMADVENHYVYQEYQTIMKNLKASGYGELYRDFDTAKKDRMKKRDH